MNRKEFLSEFLGALGAKEIDWIKENESSISGRVIYEPSDPEENQEFCWHVNEKDVPSRGVKNLAKLLKDKHILSIDQITVSRAELLDIFNQTYGKALLSAEFQLILEKLKGIEVTMIDEGKESDAYCIHE